MAQLKTTNEIGLLAIDVHQCIRDRKRARNRLEDAYVHWRNITGTHHRIERDSSEWNRMMKATKSEYLVLEEAKRRERNAARRLERAIASGVRV